MIAYTSAPDAGLIMDGDYNSSIIIVNFDPVTGEIVPEGLVLILRRQSRYRDGDILKHFESLGKPGRRSGNITRVR